MSDISIDGQFSLDKVLNDKRISPRALYPPRDEDILIIDQHTNQDDIVEYQKTVGIVKRSESENGKFNFNWVITDPGLKELVKHAKNPQKLFKYSPEFKPVNPTEDYPDGEYGMVKYIAIVDSKLANDSDAYSTKIYNLVKNIIKGDEDMKQEEVQKMIDKSIEPITEKIGKIDELQEAVNKQDWSKIDEITGQLKDLPKLVEKVEGIDSIKVQVEDLVKNQKQVIKEDEEKRENLVKNIKTNGGISESTLKKMSISELEEMDTKLAKNIKGYGSVGKPAPKSIIDKINEEYGTDLGSKLKE